MESISSGQILYELKTCRYRIMNVLDSLYGTLTIFGNEYLQDNGKTLLKGDYFFSEDKEPYIFKENYTFIDKKIYFLIDELLRYEDLSYRGNSSRKLNIDTYYFNIIKKLLIKTYYYLTDDENIKDSIIHNSKYGINKISTSLLDSVIKGKKKNTRIKKNFEKNK